LQIRFTVPSGKGNGRGLRPSPTAFYIPGREHHGLASRNLEEQKMSNEYTPELLEALKRTLIVLEIASRKFTERHRLVLNGRWGEPAIKAAKLASAKAEGRA
jgi:hypothetical protein